jgi:hypothetical protein
VTIKVANLDFSFGSRREAFGTAAATAAGLITLTVAFVEHGWTRIGLLIVSGALLLPAVFIVGFSLLLLVLGAAFEGLLNQESNAVQRSAFLVLTAAFGVLLGLTAAGSPSELALTPAGLLGAGFMVRGGRYQTPGIRRRFAVGVAVAAVAAGITGLYVLR